MVERISDVNVAGTVESDARQLLAAVAQVSDKPVRYVINTHYHGDHSFGNWWFLPALIVGQARCRTRLIGDAGESHKSMLARFAPMAKEQIDAVPVAAPELTFDETCRLHLGDLTLRLEYFGRAHTDNDITMFYRGGIDGGGGYAEFRMVRLDKTEHTEDDRYAFSYFGRPVVGWEGDTLVIETRNLTDRTGVAINGGGTRHTENMVLTERITRIAPDRLYYEATFDDPETWTAPWTVGYPIVDKPTYQVYEYACHEGNYGMTNILSGARAKEKSIKEPAGS